MRCNQDHDVFLLCICFNLIILLKNNLHSMFCKDDQDGTTKTQNHNVLKS